MKKKSVWIIFACAMILMGCTDKKSEVSEPKKSAMVVSGEIGADGLRQLDLAGLKEKIENKEDFLVMVSQSTCTYCSTMKQMLLPYMDTHLDIPFFEVEMDLLGDKKSDASTTFSELEKIIPSFGGATPEFFHYKDGEMKMSQSGALSYIAWKNFMIDCGYESGEKQEEPIKSSSLAQSDYFSTVTFTQVKDKIENGNDFYVLVVEEDQYNASLTMSLANVLKEEKQEVLILNISNPKEEANEKTMQASYQSVTKTLNTLSLTPTLFHISESAIKGNSLEDNASEEEISAWFASQK